MLVKEDKLYIFSEEMKYLKHTQLAQARTKFTKNKVRRMRWVLSFMKLKNFKYMAVMIFNLLMSRQKVPGCIINKCQV